MKHLPRVLIVGRPNVGKSTLINKIIRKRKAITMDTPGVTRDIVEFNTDWNGIPFVLMDSGGVFFAKSKDIYLQNRIEENVKKAVEECQKIVFVTDYQTGLHTQDKSIAKLLRKHKEKVILAVNKVDNRDLRDDIWEFQKLGLGDPTPISSVHGSGVADLMDRIIVGFNESDIDIEWAKDVYRIAIVGRPNVGKSSLINALLNEDRVLVDNESGTTRDAIEVYFEHDKKKYFFIDTAGMRRKARIKDDVEYYSVVRSSEMIRTADLVIVVLEANQYISDQDKKIINQVLEMDRNLIIFINKWDLTERTDENRRYLEAVAAQEFPALAHYPFVFGSALVKHQFGKLFKMIPDIIERSQQRISTADLNRFVDEVIMHNPPPAKGGQRIKIFYATQPQVSPPNFVFFINNPKLVAADYHRFVEKRLREYFGTFEGVPINLKFKGRSQKSS